MYLILGPLYLDLNLLINLAKFILLKLNEMLELLDVSKMVFLIRCYRELLIRFR